MNEMIFGFKDMVVLMTAFLGLLYGSFFLMEPKRHIITSRLMAGFMLTGSINLIMAVALYSPALQHAGGNRLLIADLLNAYDLLVWLEGLLLFFFTRFTLFKNLHWQKTDFLHALFPLLYLTIQYLFYYRLPEASRLDLVDNESSFILAWDIISAHSARVIYGVACIRAIFRYQEKSRDEYSTGEAPGLAWLKLLTYGYVISRIGWLLTPVLTTVIYALQVDAGSWGRLKTPGNMVIDIIWLLCFVGLIYFAAKHSPYFKKAPEKTNDKTLVRYTSEQVKDLLDHMENKKPFLNPTLNLEKLAEDLSATPKTLSKIINHKFNRNFCDFINHYRIQEAAFLLSLVDSEQTSITEILFKAGFNSKSVFNQSFKKHTGMTPAQYRRQRQNARLENQTVNDTVPDTGP